MMLAAEARLCPTAQMSCSRPPQTPHHSNATSDRRLDLQINSQQQVCKNEHHALIQNSRVRVARRMRRAQEVVVSDHCSKDGGC